LALSTYKINGFVDGTRSATVNGTIHASVRYSAGTNMVALWLHAVQFVAQGQILRVKWKGTAKQSVNPTREVAFASPVQG
jgi:hypothetical protein